MLEEDFPPQPEETGIATDLTQQSAQPEDAPPIAPSKPRGIAPLWHTLLLIVAILAYSFWGAQRIGDNNPILPVHKQPHAASLPAAKANATPASEDSLRILRYALSAGLELLVVLWVYLGLRLRKIPFRSLFGNWPRGLNDITKEAGIAGVFWICSMFVLLTFALTWNAVQTVVYQHELKSQPPVASSTPDKPGAPSKSESAPAQRKPKSPQQEQADNVKELMQLAPANSLEIAAWGLLCLIVGFSEEIIFRGYFQSQGISLIGSIAISVVLTSLVFGAAHGYQGLRGICLIGIYGALFSGISLLRRNLFPAMLSHAWHDFATGLALAAVRETHLLDHLPKS